MRPCSVSPAASRLFHADLPYPAGAAITIVVDNVEADREAANKSAGKLAASGYRVKLASMPAGVTLMRP